jgi:hypothetical protein
MLILLLPHQVQVVQVEAVRGLNIQHITLLQLLEQQTQVAVAVEDVILPYQAVA